jgi:hypothetical protein
MISSAWISLCLERRCSIWFSYPRAVLNFFIISRLSQIALNASLTIFLHGSRTCPHCSDKLLPMRINARPLEIVLLSAVIALLTACPRVELNRDRADEIKGFGNQALTGSTSFLKGAPVGALGVGRRLETLAMSQPDSKAFIQRYAPGLKRQFSGVRLQDYNGSGCGTVPSTSYKDVDNDGIPQNLDGSAFTYNFVNCTKTVTDDNTGQSVTATLTGAVTLKDSDDNAATSGYTFTAKDFKFKFDSTVEDDAGGTVRVVLSLTLNGTDTVSAGQLSSDTQTATFKDIQDIRFNFDAIAGSDFIKIQSTTKSTVTFTSIAPTGDVFGFGYVNSSGKFSYSVALSLNGKSASTSSSFDMALKNVYIDREVCPEDVTDSGVSGKDGSASFSDEFKNVLTWDIIPFDAGGPSSGNVCGQGTWSLNGIPQ